VAGAASLDDAVARLYRDRRALLVGGAWHLASWLVGTGEVWLALRVLGYPVDLHSALLLESLGQAIRAAAFAVPGALGVQEGGFLLLGPAVGITPETALALSLAKRVREIILGLPGLVAWQLDRTLVGTTDDRQEGGEG
jgi:putative membrane protein